MSIIDDCVQFLEDLILGDFNEEQMVSAQVVGGLISLIPVVDQVMDVRDVSGSLYRINKAGGMAKASLDQKVGLGFAAFGVIPEIGSAFKTVFKPLYKERKALKGSFNGGVAMIERMLGAKKGGAVKWVRTLDWAGNTQAAITQANLALESSIQLLEYIAIGHWWCPDHLEQLARDVAPSMKSMRGKFAGPIREASNEIKTFLEEMLGEHAAAVAMAVAQNAAATPRAAHGGHTRTNVAAPHTTHGSHTSGSSFAPPASRGRQHEPIAERPRTQAKVSASNAVTSVQTLAYEGYKLLDHAVKGLLGEHIVDHHVIEQKGWGLEWNGHDWIGCGEGGKKPGWQSQPQKINDKGVPLYLCTPSTHVLTNGIDSLWLTNRTAPHQYAVVEAKASMNQNPQLLNLLGEAKDDIGPTRKSGSRKAAAAPIKAEKSKNMQMGHAWIRHRIRKDFRSHAGSILLGEGNYSRHVFLVTPVQAASHIEAMKKIMEEGLIDRPHDAQKYAPIHARHDIHKEFGETDLDKAERTYLAEGKPKRKPKK